jgi:hypothetical protein
MILSEKNGFALLYKGEFQIGYGSHIATRYETLREYISTLNSEPPISIEELLKNTGLSLLGFQELEESDQVEILLKAFSRDNEMSCDVLSFDYEYSVGTSGKPMLYFYSYIRDENGNKLTSGNLVPHTDKFGRVSTFSAIKSIKVQLTARFALFDVPKFNGASHCLYSDYHRYNYFTKNVRFATDGADLTQLGCTVSQDENDAYWMEYKVGFKYFKPITKVTVEQKLMMFLFMVSIIAFPGSFMINPDYRK